MCAEAERSPQPSFRGGAKPPTVIQRRSEAEPKNLSSYPFANGYEFRFLGLRLEMTIERLASINDNPINSCISDI
jgi:hypothetical protein